MENAKGSTAKRNYWFPVSNGIFEHRERIKDALWLFLWYIDRTTKEDEGGDGGKVGRVLGGKPILDSEVARDLQCTKRTVCTWRNRLHRCGYIKATRAPYGYTVRVLKSKKWFRENSASRRTGSGKNSASLSHEVGEILPTDLPFASQTGKRTVNLIKTTQDSTVSETKTNQPTTAGDLVGRLAFIFREKTGKHLGFNRGQRANIAALASNNGEADVIASFERWLGRTQGIEGIVWPLAVFFAEYGSYSVRQEREQRDAKVREVMAKGCPMCMKKETLETNGRGSVRCRECMYQSYVGG